MKKGCVRALNVIAFCFDFKIRRQSPCSLVVKAKVKNDDFEYFQVDFNKVTFESNWVLESLPGTNLGSSQRAAKR